MCNRPQQSFLRHIYEVALESRAWAEDLARETGRNPTTLRGLCAIAALDLFRRLKAAGLDPTFGKSEHHCFCLVERLVVDVTGTQFVNCDPINGVWIADLSDEDNHGVWTVLETASSEEEILSLSSWSRWPEDERPQISYLQGTPWK